MEEDATFEALKQILPELEARLRENMEQEFQIQLERIKVMYQQQTEEKLRKRQLELKAEAQNNEVQLRKQLSMLQRERQQWLLLERNYKQTIYQLGHKNQKGNCGQLALNQLYPSNISEYSAKMLPNKSQWSKNVQKESKNSEEDQLLLEEVPSMSFINESRVKTWKKNKPKASNPGAEQFKARGQRQDTMVLSPPRTNEEYKMKESVLQPPAPPGTKNQVKSSIFWNDDGKKKLLSMIRNIK